ncbi:MAG: GDP-mannose 4,6-dehydratase [Candidatus Eremiobacteraeota bacterium]|nr:GDP-mannose 4,6-dehydratase [Candidatus Eremiobacteraeota bacterium]MBV8365027.1 GDP-mannose 4,6-dehydratase [Candidatus Eremiobacteraeota bacterium]
MRALVTGADGFVGQWLLRELLAHGDEVTGVTRGDHTRLTTLPTEAATQIRWLSADILDLDALVNAVSEARPDAIYHLAAQASVAESLRDPAGTVDTNVMGTANLLEATRAKAPEALVVAVGSAEIYGSVEPNELPLNESAPLHPNNPYAGSKAAAEMVALQYAQTGWARVLATRSFNHTGPGQSVTFAAAGFAKQCADITRGKQAPVLQHGNLSAQRDFLDVRDVASAYRRLGERGESGSVYNVCSGRAVSMREIVEELIHLVGLPVELRQDPQRMRPVDTPVIVGDPSRIRRDTGWQPQLPLLRTLRDLYDYFLKEDG